MIENPKIGQEVWFAEACNQRIHNEKLSRLAKLRFQSKNIHMQILNLRMDAD